MMKIQYASDLHLEFKENVDWFLENPIIPTGDILVLAGDIAYLGTELYSEHPFWDWCSRNFNQTIVVPGNHELYRSFDINELYEGWTLDIRANVKAYYNSVISLDGETDLIASTLWAHIPPSESLILQVFYNYILAKIEALTSEMEDSSISLLDMVIKYDLKYKK